MTSGAPLDHPGVDLPPPVYSLIAVGLGYQLDKLRPWPLAMPHSAQIAGLLFAAGLFLLSWAALGFYHNRTTILPHRANSALIEDGAFRHSRNPIYLSFLVLLTAVALAADNGWLLALVPANWLCLRWRVIKREEAYLLRRHGKLYSDYCRRVRRWL